MTRETDRRPTVRQRLRAAYACLRGQSVIFNTGLDPNGVDALRSSDSPRVSRRFLDEGGIRASAVLQTLYGSPESPGRDDE